MIRSYELITSCFHELQIPNLLTIQIVLTKKKITEQTNNVVMVRPYPFWEFVFNMTNYIYLAPRIKQRISKTANSEFSRITNQIISDEKQPIANNQRNKNLF